MNTPSPRPARRSTSLTIQAVRRIAARKAAGIRLTPTEMSMLCAGVVAYGWPKIKRGLAELVCYAIAANGGK